MNAHSLAFLLRKYGILTAQHATHCAVMAYSKYQGGELPACTCALAEIQAEVRKQMSDMPEGSHADT